MLIHLARISVVTIALALVGTLGVVLARPAPPTVIAVVVPQAAAPTTVVQPTVVPAYWPYAWTYCGRARCYWGD